MKTSSHANPRDAAPIVQAVREGHEHPEAAAQAALPAPDELLARARDFAANLLAGRRLDTGEPALEHAHGVAGILQAIGGAPSLQAAAYLVYAGDYLQQPEVSIAAAFGERHAWLVTLTRKLVAIQRSVRGAQLGEELPAQAQALQLERVRKMLLAFSRDLRVVLLRLASRLQTLRWHMQQHQPCPRELAEESLQVFAPLANRLGIWQIKWELEDLAFRTLQPEAYRRLADGLAERRIAREADVAGEAQRLRQLLAEAGIPALVKGRPKHLYSIWKKMQGKRLPLERVFDVRALRVIVADVPACYAALSEVHARHVALPEEFDDYIARPKPNGYQSLHTVVRGDDGRAIEVQIRTQAMHDHAELGVAAHWAYKEAGAKGYGGVSAAGDFEARVAEARRAVLHQLLAWEREQAFARPGRPAADGSDAAQAGAMFADRIYVFTPGAEIIELPAGATPVDFAYALHTDVGHRCRGARIDGVLSPLNTALVNGQTLEVITVREGGPSLDWLNPELGYLHSARAKSKVRAWFNAQAALATVARGRELVEKLLQREGRTTINQQELAAQLGFKTPEALFEVVGKDEFSLRQIEQVLKPRAAVAAAEADAVAVKRARGGASGVLVVGVESLLTTLARCCRPAPPDAIGGYVTRGKGVAIHRRYCSNFQHMAQAQPERVIEVEWGEAPAGKDAAYPVDVAIEAAERHGLLRDISEVFTKDKLRVIAVQSSVQRTASGAAMRMTLTVEVPGAAALQAALAQLRMLPGIRHARRR